MKDSICVVCGAHIPLKHTCLVYYSESEEKVYVACLSHEGTSDLEEKFQEIKRSEHAKNRST